MLLSHGAHIRTEYTIDYRVFIKLLIFHHSPTNTEKYKIRVKKSTKNDQMCGAVYKSSKSLGKGK